MKSLERLIGPLTALLVGVGVAVGSGIFRTPALIAQQISSPWWIVGLWVSGGAFVFIQGLVTAELATRFPQAGGEYVFLREAYGEFVAFFFGWAYTVFIIGGGAATIAAAAGESLADLAGTGESSAPLLAAACVVLVTGVNALGLKSGAAFQNLLTLLKVGALLLVAGLAVSFGEGATSWRPSASAGTVSWLGLLAAFPAMLWSYEGTTDAVKLAEEVEDPNRDLPRALLGAALALTLLYTLVNVAYLYVLSPSEMASSSFVANDILQRIFGPSGARVMAAISLVVFLGALSSTILATVRVTFALARDGLAFGVLAKMSDRQAPVPALIASGAIATMFCLFRDFRGILDIYFLASAVLFGLSYASLMVFRVRDAKSGEGFPAGAFRCPLGPGLACFLIAFQILIAWNIIRSKPVDSLYTLTMLMGFAGLYFVWKRVRPD